LGALTKRYGTYEYEDDSKTDEEGTCCACYFIPPAFKTFKAAEYPFCTDHDSENQPKLSNALFQRQMAVARVTAMSRVTGLGNRRNL